MSTPNPGANEHVSANPPAAGPPPDRTAVTTGPPASGAEPPLTLKAECRNFHFYYGGKFHALKNINLRFPLNQVSALIGPSGCGKSTMLRSFNRMHDLYHGNRYEGEILLHPSEINIVSPSVDPIEMRMRIGMVFQKPNPFPKSIFENVAFGLRLKGITNQALIAEKVESALSDAAMWDEVKDRLSES